MDHKILLFFTFSVCFIGIDLGTDTNQSIVYIKEGNNHWGYTTIAAMFVPLAAACLYILLSRRHRLWQCEKGIWWDSLKSVFRHFPLVQPFVHFYYLKSLMNAKAKIDRSMDFYKSFR